MRVKTLAAVAGLACLTAVVAVPGISNASRLNTRTQPLVQTDTTTTAPVVETPTTQPVETTTTTAAPVETTTTTAAPVAEVPTTQPKPVVTKPTAPPPVVSAPVPAPVVATPPAVPPVDITTVGPVPAPVTTDQKPADPCHMDDFHAVAVSSLGNPSEAARAHKVDRNGNGIVCRKDIPGRGRGNTGQGSNIKDDQAG